MPSSSNTPFIEKLHHAKVLLRVMYHRGDVNAVWDQPEDKLVVEQFLGRCIEESQISFQELLMIHDSELVLLFDLFDLTPRDRCTVRRYLELPEDALWALWTAAKVSLFCVAGAFRLSRAVLGVPGVLLLSAGVGVGLVGRSMRTRILEEVRNTVERHRDKLHIPTSPNALSNTRVPPIASAATPQNNNNGVDGLPPLATINGLTAERLRSNPFYNPDDHPQKTPRYPPPNLGHYDFRSASGSPPATHVDDA